MEKSTLRKCTKSAKYPVPKVADLLGRFLEAYDWLTAYNRGKVFNMPNFSY